MEASQREKYKSGPFTKQRDTKYRGEERGGKKEMEKNAVDCNRYRNEGRRGRGGEWINDTGHGVETKHRLREL